MNIDISKLEIHKKNGNKIIARCPACQEMGQDKKGNHLVIFEDGCFGCVAYPGDSGKEHRKKIFELISSLKGSKLEIRVKKPSQSSQPHNSIIMKDVLGHLGLHFSSCLEKKDLCGKDKTEELIELYEDITNNRKYLSRINKISNVFKYKTLSNYINNLENKFSSSWDTLDSFKQKFVFEALCKKGVLPEIIKKTSDVFNAKIISLV